MTATIDKPRLETLYSDEVKASIIKEFNLANVSLAPKLAKITVNIGIGRFLDNQKLKPEIKETVISTLTQITGQKPIMILAKKSVANFKVREGAPSAFMVTMRGEKMWYFLDRLISLAIPRIKDFRGLKDTSFDQAGNYSFGVTEQAVWPEINMAEVHFTHGMNINLVFENSTPELSKAVLTQLGMPFVRDEE
ncbi:MAG: 50S ribosomal protein L5 [Phycisphaerae bacterium]|jgi:large subunit ribosomal protein L5|nr:50S ribosomal protein L5 [Phycisphaerae bacterium]MBT6270423.1 50S ribosomal protein L5 [Phycisphaerae bacterium]MBT6282785.1 50S ribosomal protein L5 [Phycisphaerae bacterium]